MAKKVYRITGFQLEKAFFDTLGIEPDDDSRPEILEWYWTFESAIDARAAMNLFTEKHGFILLRSEIYK